MNNKCKYCRHIRELQYKRKSEQPYKKYVCGNRLGICAFSQVKPDDFCSRFEEKELPAVKIGDEVIVDGVKGIVVREPYQIGNPDDPWILVLVWYGCHMGDAKLRDVQPTGKKYPEIVKIME